MTSGVVTVKAVDMRDEMRLEAISCAMQALEAHDVEKDIAAFIKKYFDSTYEPTWHCIVGQSFGSFVTHESGHFIYLYIGQHAVLLFKAG